MFRAKSRSSSRGVCLHAVSHAQSGERAHAGLAIPCTDRRAVHEAVSAAPARPPSSRVGTVSTRVRVCQKRTRQLRIEFLCGPRRPAARVKTRPLASESSRSKAPASDSAYLGRLISISSSIRIAPFATFQKEIASKTCISACSCWFRCWARTARTANPFGSECRRRNEIAALRSARIIRCAEWQVHHVPSHSAFFCCA